MLRSPPPIRKAEIMFGHQIKYSIFSICYLNGLFLLLSLLLLSSKSKRKKPISCISKSFGGCLLHRQTTALPTPNPNPSCERERPLFVTLSPSQFHHITPRNYPSIFTSASLVLPSSGQFLHSHISRVRLRKKNLTFT